MCDMTVCIPRFVAFVSFCTLLDLKILNALYDTYMGIVAQCCRFFVKTKLIQPGEEKKKETLSRAERHLPFPFPYFFLHKALLPCNPNGFITVLSRGPRAPVQSLTELPQSAMVPPARRPVPSTYLRLAVVSWLFVRLMVFWILLLLLCFLVVVLVFDFAVFVVVVVGFFLFVTFVVVVLVVVVLLEVVFGWVGVGVGVVFAVTRFEVVRAKVARERPWAEM